MEKNSQNFSMDEAMRLAKSPAGQQLISLLRHTNGGELQKAMDLASAGDMKGASKILNALLSSNDQAQALLDQLGG